MAGSWRTENALQIWDFASGKVDMCGSGGATLLEVWVKMGDDLNMSDILDIFCPHWWIFSTIYCMFVHPVLF